MIEFRIERFHLKEHYPNSDTLLFNLGPGSSAPDQFVSYTPEDGAGMCNTKQYSNEVCSFIDGAPGPEAQLLENGDEMTIDPSEWAQYWTHHSGSLFSGVPFVSMNAEAQRDSK